MNAQTLPNDGYCYDWTHRMAGLRFEGRAERIEFVKDRRIVDRNETCTPSTLMWTHQPEGAGTVVTVSIDYSAPGPYSAEAGACASPVVVTRRC